MNSTLLFALATLVIFNPHSAFASTDPQVALLAQVEGKTQIFTQPSKTAHQKKNPAAGTMALYEGQYYLIQDAKTGDRVENGVIVRTLPGAKAKVLYPNGDQFYVGPGTAYRIEWKPKKSDGIAQVELMYGRMRGVISKEGPRKKLQIRTKSATMGVRGTDFFIADTGPDGETEVSVIRGSVEVRPNPKSGEPKETKKESVAQEIKTGQSAAVAQTIEVRSTTKEDLSGIKEASTLSAQPSPAASLPAPQQNQVMAEIAALEKKAVEVTLKDIQTYQPEVYKQIEAQPGQVKQAQDLNNKTVEIAAVQAPSAPPKRRKPRITEIKDASDADYYDKYFKLEN
jgi:hypothetical protein